ncbi:unnamed protein product [Paramecium primaurelia]|uniref:Transmembrane protein n=1 Tax=Paramecium primaurelia TaxID=5886 RepID=A0A8S1L2D1_PARPR|nr:unnamed protein product [Paramecium primaurelia]
MIQLKQNYALFQVLSDYIVKYQKKCFFLIFYDIINQCLLQFINFMKFIIILLLITLQYLLVILCMNFQTIEVYIRCFSTTDVQQKLILSLLNS